MKHAAGCGGGHISKITCEDHIAWVAEVLADPWHCWGEGSNGYHLWPGGDDPPLSQTCEREGCERTWGELQDELRRRGVIESN